MLRIKVSKSDSEPMLGPPRNAFLWQRAREVASAAHQNPSFSEIYQVYQMLTLAPGFMSVGGVIKSSENIDWTPPQGVRDACRRGLELREEHGGDGLTPNAVRWAGKLANGDAITPMRARAMYAFHARHRFDQRAGWGNEKTPGYVASLLWGGSAGRSWSSKLRRQEKAIKSMRDLLASGRVLRKKNVGDDDEGAWEYAKKQANRRGKPKSYAAAIFRNICKKAFGFPVAIDIDPLARVRAGFKDNSGQRIKDMVGAMMDAAAPQPLPLPSKTVGSVAEALGDMGLDYEVFRTTADVLQNVINESKSSKEAAAVTQHVMNAVPDLSGDDRRELAYRIAFLHQLFH